MRSRDHRKSRLERVTPLLPAIAAFADKYKLRSATWRNSNRGRYFLGFVRMEGARPRDPGVPHWREVPVAGKYTGEVLRAIRARKGVGRPVLGFVR
jgi:hypothetical protein